MLLCALTIVGRSVSTDAMVVATGPDATPAMWNTGASMRRLRARTSLP